MKPSLLILVPTLNSYKDLPPLCSSLLSQSFLDWRVLFIDGPSSSSHKAWLDNFCSSNSRFNWVAQDKSHPGIFGAMNQGFLYSQAQDWVLFWGSDDRASAQHVFDEAIACIKSSVPLPDLLVCQGRYIDESDGSLGRITRFCKSCILDSTSYRRALFLGSTPPHQATFFGPSARSKITQFSGSYRLSADLDYFLQLSFSSFLSVRCLDLELVHMGDGGVSGKQTIRRLQEVRIAYQRSFGWLWLIPFVARYLRRAISIFKFF